MTNETLEASFSKVTDLKNNSGGCFMKCSDFTILVAEDDPSLRKIYEKSLLAEGYRLILAESGARALAELHETPVDLLITDMKMETMSALEMLPIIKRDHPKLPVIVVSGRYGGLEEDFRKKGFDNVESFFQKPLSMDVLKQKIRAILRIEVGVKS
jgi:DNA-binding response OmpR family regulator